MPAATPSRCSRCGATDLTLRQVVSSGGTFPVSVAVHGNLVSVLNARNGGSVQEYYAFFGHLFPVPGSNRALGLTIPSDTTQFTHTPGQVAYSPDGSKLIVTTKASSNAVDVFNVGFFGNLSRFAGGEHRCPERSPSPSPSTRPVTW